MLSNANIDCKYQHCVESYPESEYYPYENIIVINTKNLLYMVLLTQIFSSMPSLQKTIPTYKINHLKS